MTNARTTQQIIDDGASPAAAAQQAQLERWQYGHRLTLAIGEPYVSLDDLIVADEVDAYAADAFMSANPVKVIKGEGADVFALTAERFGPLPQREAGVAGGRARAIAGLHALADYLLDHPDIPTPESVYVFSYVGSALELEQLGEHLGVEPARRDGEAVQLSLAAVEPRTYQVLVSLRRADRPQ